MRILMLSKALVSGAYQTKCEELAALPGVELTVLVPPSWREPRVGELALERRHTRGYRLEAIPILMNGRHHLHCYPTLGPLVAAARPDVFHIDEESFNLATFLAMRAGVKAGARCCFYSYANIERRYPPPFSLFERYSFRHASHALAANHEAADILRRHGYAGPVSVIPQFGVDLGQFAPAERGPRQPGQLLVGYVGRLVPEKGVGDLLDALALLPEGVRLRVVGDGSERAALEARAHALGLGGRVEWRGWTSDAAAELRELDALALPSRTTRTWKEQFGRILVEAMSSGVAVVGSDSGEIPHVIGGAGLTFPEGDSAALAARLRDLAERPELRDDLARRGRERAQSQYAQGALARRYLAIYRSMLSEPAS